MRCATCALLTLSCCVAFSGCGSGEADKLRAEIEQLRERNQSYNTEVAALQSVIAKLRSDLASAQQELAEVEEIKRGYEAARVKLEENLSQLGPLLGNAGTGSPLPKFEDLKNSDWVGKFAPSGELPANLKALESELKGLLGDQGILLDGSPKKKTKP